MIAFVDNCFEFGADAFLFPCSTEGQGDFRDLSIYFPPSILTYNKLVEAKKLVLGRTVGGELKFEGKQTHIHVYFLPLKRLIHHKAQRVDIERALTSLANKLQNKKMLIAYPLRVSELRNPEVIRFAYSLFKSHSCTLVFGK